MLPVRMVCQHTRSAGSQCRQRQQHTVCVLGHFLRVLVRRHQQLCTMCHVRARQALPSFPPNKRQITWCAAYMCTARVCACVSPCPATRCLLLISACPCLQAPLHYSNVMLVDPLSKKPARTYFMFEDQPPYRRVRACAQCERERMRERERKRGGRERERHSVRERESERGRERLP